MNHDMELVSVQYEFEYTAKDGRLVSIKPNESYILVSKTNEHWWHVRKDQHSRPFYIPAQYVKELLSLTENPPGPNSLKSPECVTNSKPGDMAHITPRKATTVNRVSALASWLKEIRKMGKHVMPRSVAFLHQILLLSLNCFIKHEFRTSHRHMQHCEDELQVDTSSF
uniref:SH3 domain-containing protein n=1 Tax=Sander lucioperca TaxID=283035 RepID=A0A8D0DDM9_SANLU